MEQTLGDRLKYLRKKKKLTQVQLSNSIGVKQGTYSRWENNTLEPNFEALVKLASVLDTTTNYLLGETDNDFDYSSKNIEKNYSKLNDEERKTLLIEKINDLKLALLIASKESDTSVDNIIKELTSDEREIEILRQIHQSTLKQLKEKNSGNTLETTDIK